VDEFYYYIQRYKSAGRIWGVGPYSGRGARKSIPERTCAPHSSTQVYHHPRNLYTQRSESGRSVNYLFFLRPVSPIYPSSFVSCSVHPTCLSPARLEQVTLVGVKGWVFVVCLLRDSDNSLRSNRVHCL
jgi:hypothetical protein